MDQRHCMQGTDLIVSELPRMREYARYLARDAALADDLVQDAVTRALVKMPERDQERSLRSWLFAIVRNRHLDIVRRGRKAPDGTGVDADEIAHAIPDDRLEATGFLHDLNEAMAMLPGELRETMWLVGVQEYSYAETAEVLGIPIGTVRSRVFRAREALREAMADYFPRVEPTDD